MITVILASVGSRTVLSSIIRGEYVCPRLILFHAVDHVLLGVRKTAG
jgi:hypothetical protein